MHILFVFIGQFWIKAIEHLRKNIKIYTYTNKEEFILNHMLKYKIDGIVSNVKIEIWHKLRINLKTNHKFL